MYMYLFSMCILYADTSLVSTHCERVWCIRNSVYSSLECSNRAAGPSGCGGIAVLYSGLRWIYSGLRWREWCRMVQITVVWTVNYSSLQSLEWWLMRHSKNSHFITLYHTSLHCPTCAHTYTLSTHMLLSVYSQSTAGPLCSLPGSTLCVYTITVISLKVCSSVSLSAS